MSLFYFSLVYYFTDLFAETEESDVCTKLTIMKNVPSEIIILTYNSPLTTNKRQFEGYKLIIFS